MTDNFFSHVPYIMCGVAIRILHCNGGRIPRTMEQIAGLPGAGRKCTALSLTDCWEDQSLLTGDTHVCLGATAYEWVPHQLDKAGELPSFNPDRISQYIEALISKESGLRRILNSAFAGLKQLWNYEGDETKRELARSTIKAVATEKKHLKKIMLLLDAKHASYFKTDSGKKGQTKGIGKKGQKAKPTAVKKKRQVKNKSENNKKGK